MISYCIVAYRPPFVTELIEDLIRKTSCPYEILVWANTTDQKVMELIRAKQAQNIPIQVIGVTPHNIGMEGFRHLFQKAKYDIITQMDDDVLRVSRNIGETAQALFSRHPKVRQLVADCWQDQYTNGARPLMSCYKPISVEDQLYYGPVDGWFSMYHRAGLALLMKAPFARYVSIGSWMANQLNCSGYHGALCTKFKVFHATGPQYSELYGLLDFQIAKYRGVGMTAIADLYENARKTLPPRTVIEESQRVAFHGLDTF